MFISTGEVNHLGRFVQAKQTLGSEGIGVREPSTSPFLDLAFSHCIMPPRAAKDFGMNHMRSISGVGLET